MDLFIIDSHDDKGNKKSVFDAFKKFGLLKHESYGFFPNDIVLEKIGFRDYQVRSYESVMLEKPIPPEPIKVCLFRQITVFSGSVCTNYYQGMRKQPNGKIVPFQHYFGGRDGLFCPGYHTPGEINKIETTMIEELFGKCPMQIASFEKMVEIIESDKFHEFYVKAMQTVGNLMLPVIQHVDDRLARMHTADPENLPTLTELRHDIEKLEWSNRRKNLWSVPNRR